MAIALALAASFPAAADDWPQFRGLQRNGSSAEKGLARSWPEAGPTELWRVPLGPGFSGIAVADGRLYTMFSETRASDSPQPAAPKAEAEAEEMPADTAGDDHTEPAAEAPPQELVAAFDAETGRELWQVPVGEAFVNEYGDGPRSTPTVDGDRIYAVSARGRVLALNRKDGSLVWQVDLAERFEARVPYWGFSTSVAIVGDLVILEAGGLEDRSFAALDKATGETRWTWGDGARGYGYNSPMVVPGEASSQILFVASDRLVSVNSRGEEVWSHPWAEADTLVMPLFVPPATVMVSASNTGAMAVRPPLGEGAEPRELWTTRGMKNHFSAPVGVGEAIFGFDNAIFRAIATGSGDPLWARRGFGKGSVITADGLLFVLSDRGKLVLAEASPEGFEEVGSVDALEGKSWTSPSLANGHLYLRNTTEMVAYDVRSR